MNPHHPTSAAEHESSRAAPLLICPYCGGVTNLGSRCEKCRGLLDPLSRQATQNTMGPWFIRDEANPFRPGCSYETMKALALRGRIGPDTVVRGPTTRQFWCAARRAPGIAHLVGFCPDCGADVHATDANCDECGADFVIELDRQFLGLGSVAPVPGQAVPDRAQDAPAQARAPAAEIEPPRDAMLAEVQTGLSSTRSTLHWVTASVVIIVMGLLALAYVALRSARTPAVLSPPPATVVETPALPPPQPAQVEPSPVPAPSAVPAQTAPPPANTRSPELARAAQLLEEGTKESLADAVRLADSASDAGSAEWLAIKAAAEQRLALLKLRNLR